jgi:propanol-preferring alcohol dehydrogenase
MKAMRMTETANVEGTAEPRSAVDVDTPSPGENEILVQVSACGVCHTELDEIEGRTEPPELPVTPGHEVVVRVADRGAEPT